MLFFCVLTHYECSEVSLYQKMLRVKNPVRERVSGGLFLYYANIEKP